MEKVFITLINGGEVSASEYKEAMLKIFFDLNGQQQQDQQEELQQNITSNVKLQQNNNSNEELISKDENRRN